MARCLGMRNSAKIPGPGYGTGRTPTGTRMKGIGRRQSVFSSLVTKRYLIADSTQHFNAKFGGSLGKQPVDSLRIGWKHLIEAAQGNQTFREQLTAEGHFELSDLKSKWPRRIRI